MKEMYSIVQREVNPLTAKIKVRVCESGTKEELTRGINYCRIAKKLLKNSKRRK